MPLPNYYQTLNIPPTASSSEIRTAYKKASLLTHPDRVPFDDPSRPSRTRKFQEVNDAYYTLSDARRRREYDEALRGDNMAGGRGGWGSWGAGEEEAETMFEDVFEEMMREEGLSPDAETGDEAEGKGGLYSVLGGVSGAVLGFIVGNVPGALVGAAAGGTLGGVRDKRGKSVYEVFSALPQSEKARLLMELAQRVLGHMGGTAGVSN